MKKLDFRPNVFSLGDKFRSSEVIAEGCIRDTETEVVWIRHADGSVNRYDQKTGERHILPRELEVENKRGSI